MEQVSMTEQLHSGLGSKSNADHQMEWCKVYRQCSEEGQITLLFLAVRWSSLELMEAGRTLSAWLHCANCEV